MLGLLRPLQRRHRLFEEVIQAPRYMGGVQNGIHLEVESIPGLDPRKNAEHNHWAGTLREALIDSS